MANNPYNSFCLIYMSGNASVHPQTSQIGCKPKYFPWFSFIKDAKLFIISIWLRYQSIKTPISPI